jgi:tetratricopeptide (TPR) repeat protein
MKMNPGDGTAVRNYASAQAASGDKDGAIKTWQQWGDQHPKDASITEIIAELEDSKGDRSKAEEYYKKALQQDPNQVASANNLAYMMATNGENLDEALTLAQAARRNDASKSPSTADTLAWIYYQKGRYSSARDLLEDAVKQRPEDAAMQYHLGMTYSKLGDKAQATLHLRKAQSINPDAQTGKDAAAALTKLG